MPAYVHRSRCAPVWVALGLAIAGACGRGPEPARYTDAVPAPMLHLEAWYPDGVRAGGLTLSRALIARGDSLYHAVAPPGNCMACHGPFLTVGTGGQNLRDGRWHNGDGSYEFIVATITDGVSKTDGLSMPPRGGMPLSDADVRAIAAYVYWKTRAGASTETREAPPDTAGGPASR